MAIFSGIFNFMAIGIGIALIFYYIFNFKAINAFMNYGVLIAVIVIIIIYVGSGFVAPIMGTLISLIKIAIYISIGMYLCSILGYKDIPLIKKLLNKNDHSKIDMKKYIGSTLIVVAGSVIFTIILFKVTSPTASRYIKGTLNSEVVGDDILSIIMLILNITAIVITEEITFRFVVPNFMAKIFDLEEKKYWIAIVVASLYWALGHSNTLNPEWVKFAQIFPIGLAFGWLYKKFGLESSIIAHLCFNLILIFGVSRILTV